MTTRPRPTDPTASDSTQPPPKSRTETKPWCSATKQVTSNRDGNATVTISCRRQGHCSAAQAEEGPLNCTNGRVTADNRALNELGPIGSAHLMRASPSTGREDDGSGLDGIQRL